MRKPREEEYWLRLSTAEKRALYALAEQRDQPASQIVRQAIRNAIAEAGEPVIRGR